MDNLRDIINGAQLPRFVNKPVSIIGKIKNVSPNGMSFELQSTDDVTIKVNVKNPIDKPIAGCFVEVRGLSNGRCIIAEDFVIFNNEKFDGKSYNALCKLLYSVPRLWETS